MSVLTTGDTPPGLNKDLIDLLTLDQLKQLRAMAAKANPGTSTSATILRAAIDLKLMVFMYDAAIAYKTANPNP